MTIEEKKQIELDRRRAVKEAWARETDLVKQGKGTVEWTPQQQRELVEKGHVSGYEGHHMKSVNEYPEHAGNANNIQFLTHDEHVEAHNAGKINEKNGYHSMTNGYYDTKTKSMHSFGDRPPKEPKSSSLSHPAYKQSDKSSDKTTSQTRTNDKQNGISSKSAENHAKQSAATERGK